MTRGEVGKDGKTAPAYERLKGKKAKVQGLEFGEGVLWKRRPEGGPLGKLTCMWNDGIFLGVKGSTGELIVGDERGVWRTRTVRRKPESERWRRENIKMIAGVPWRLSEEDQNADGEGMRLDVTVMDKEYREGIARPEHEAIPRAVYIRKEDLEEFGYTVGCPGCRSILKKTTRQAHSEGCRRRLEAELEETERAKRAKKRKSEFVDRKMEEDAAGREARRSPSDQQGGAPQEERPAEDDVEEEGRKRRSDEEVTDRQTVKFLKQLAKEERKRTREEGGPDIDEVCEDLQPIPRSFGTQWGASDRDGEMMLHGKPVNEEILEVGEWYDEAMDRPSDGGGGEKGRGGVHG